MTLDKKLTAAADSSFLIGISVCEQWDALKETVDVLFIADAVWKEVVVGGQGKPGQRELQEATFVRRKSVSNIHTTNMMTAFLDIGESETLVLATELDITTVFMDDLRGRRVAQSIGLHCIGVAGFLLLAKNSKIIEEIRPSFRLLQDKGFRLSSRLMNEILNSANEKPI